ncbi:MAG: ABC transporter transmembrane domain-containing protein [Clostridia bacterium]|nr:ABC transporter transmembrane domain-containing protein [Clostridia bacterium]
MLRDFLNLLRITGGGWIYAILILLRCPVDVLFRWTQASFLQRAFNALGQTDRVGLMDACLFFVIATLCSFLYNGTIWLIFAPFCVRMERKLRIKLYNKISTFSYEKVESLPHSEWLTRLNTDVQMPFSQPIHFPHAACSIVNISVSAIMLWRLNPSVFGWVILFVVPHIFISQLLIARAMLELNKKSLEATAKNTGELTALITCADIAMLYDGQDYLMKRFEQSSLNLMKTKMKIIRRNSLSAAILPLFGLSGYLVLLIVSSSWIANGHFTFGDLSAAFQYRGGVLVGSLMLINSLISIQASMAGIRRLNKTMLKETEEQLYG